MAELDKKIQKSQADLVQSVLEAQEKKNQERVDMLVTNAIKQLKMSRFKPDQTTCLSLTYLARINPKVFMQSSAIKEVLKSLLRRDNGPTNIKSVGKSDIMLPVMAANILLACCDGVEVRTIVLNKIEQWLSSSQKIAEIVQHLLIILCLKSQGDQQTIGTLIEMRHHWLQYLDDNFTTYGQVPSDLCASVRKLLQSESNCGALLSYLGFLIKHDRDIESLGQDLSKFIINRPISITSMMKSSQLGVELNRMLLKIYIKLIAEKSSLDSMDKSEPAADEEEKAKPIVEKVEKIEPQTEKVEKCEPKVEKVEKSEPIVEDVERSETVLVKSTNDADFYEAVFTLLAMVSSFEECSEDFEELMSKVIFGNLAASNPDNMPYKLRQKLIHSSSQSLVDLSLLGANTSQLLMLLQQFGLSTQTINKILKKIEGIKDVDLVRSEIKDASYFVQLMDFYIGMKCQPARDLLKRLELSS